MTNEFSIGSDPDSVPADDLSRGDTVRCKPADVHRFNASQWERDDGYVYGTLRSTDPDAAGDYRIEVAADGASDWFNEDGIEVETDDGFVEVET